MKKETLITIFYVLYFTWLFLITYLRPDLKTINIFSLAVVFFYFTFLREKRDFLWFWAGAGIPIIANTLSFKNWVPDVDILNLITTPIWLPMIWGTTFVALRKFFLTITR
ncbi:hypothetical protein A2865_00420 [Candidatus Woesebacteria bacterium RIFCSPHIGHO2_01_FULL_39_17]|uniref:Uncharacterized protein n=2 Tax=Candidatus Woeseibacteriota TaxID=1752722 RepID=A0A0G0NAM4_9BACT|nr:MAG: hypothetical protein US72_C0014G0003 [Microgenomates group bacterium GW2011_GWC1_38_12]KKR13189.1 MAG: hypothetical protein UT40_C0022G0002 [Candidatus Woesebacteria bacterium GW2011_GWA1_39_21b]OGM24004.1 MAG: hypothetical protein A2865_00420 [Candidatus Woesebacteria bacterium RIFCSPHIGHO2_01_FULL_39_17]OGM65249.1 MAG: hypothetical protein A3A52_01855 [Candidatus Woesebacteria bacterium RIFCSPLOWO2_01_FULL_39_14]